MLSAVFPKRKIELGEVVIELRRLGCSATGIHDVNMQLRAGEMVGLAGLVPAAGAGAFSGADAALAVSLGGIPWQQDTRHFTYGEYDSDRRAAVGNSPRSALDFFFPKADGSLAQHRCFSTDGGCRSTDGRLCRARDAVGAKRECVGRCNFSQPVTLSTGGGSSGTSASPFWPSAGQAFRAATFAKRPNHCQQRSQASPGWSGRCRAAR